MKSEHLIQIILCTIAVVALALPGPSPFRKDDSGKGGIYSVFLLSASIATGYTYLFTMVMEWLNRAYPAMSPKWFFAIALLAPIAAGAYANRRRVRLSLFHIPRGRWFGRILDPHQHLIGIDASGKAYICNKNVPDNAKSVDPMAITLTRDDRLDDSMHIKSINEITEECRSTAQNGEMFNRTRGIHFTYLGEHVVSTEMRIMGYASSIAMKLSRIALLGIIFFAPGLLVRALNIKSIYDAWLPPWSGWEIFAATITCAASMNLMARLAYKLREHDQL